MRRRVEPVAAVQDAGLPLPRRLLAAAALAALPLAACGTSTGGSSTGGAGADDPTGAAAPQTLTVLAAASLTDVLEPIATDVEADHPGLDIQLSFAASSTLVQQVNEGAPADVLALAGERPLDALEDDLAAGEPTIFATNALTIAVPPDNPAGVQTLADLEDPGLTLVVCAEQVPCGTAAQALFEEQGLDPQIASFEQDVRATLTKVELGEADAGLVYATDVAAAGDRVLGVDIPAEQTVTTRYPALAVSDHELAQVFVDELSSERGRAHLSEAGFGIP